MLARDSDCLLDFFVSRRETWIDLLVELTAMDTPVGDLEASRRFVDRYRALLEAAGCRCREHDSPAGVHLVADAGGRSGDDPAVVLVAHSDTVWPAGEAQRRPPTLRDGKLFGPGSLDMRAGLVVALAFFRYLEESGGESDRGFRLFVSADEEAGSLEAREFLAREVPETALALVLEPPVPGGGLKVRRKGVGIYTLRLRGRAAHAGTRPEDGASAIDAMVELVARIHALRDVERGITLNIGQVEGGTASNVIAEAAKLTVDVRHVEPADGQRIDAALRQLVPADSRVRLELEGGIVFPPMVPDPRLDPVIERVQAIGRDLGFNLEAGSSGGGSDGSFLAARGVRTLDGLGVEGEGAHALDEHVILEKLPRRAALLTRIALEV